MKHKGRQQEEKRNKKLMRQTKKKKKNRMVMNSNFFPINNYKSTSRYFMQMETKRLGWPCFYQTK